MGPGAALKEELTSLALEQGFAKLAVARAEVDEDARRAALERLAEGAFAGLPWFDAARVLRATDPGKALPGARSVILLLAPYWHAEPAVEDGRPRGRVARYAWGRDYHRVLERRTRSLLDLLSRCDPSSRSRFLVDYGPLLERAYGRRAGLGWQGKNTMLLTRGVGSYTFLAVILTTVDLPRDEPVEQTCGACRRCLPSCPTGALRSDYELVNDLCISFQTIENRGPIPRDLRPLMGDWVFGCDLCQEACPVNDKWRPQGMDEFRPRGADAALPDLVEVLALSEQEFRERYAGTPVMRAKHAGFLRNACVALGNLGDRSAVPALRRALRHPEPLVRGHAAWALGRLGDPEALRAALEGEADDWVREEVEAALTAFATVSASTG